MARQRIQDDTHHSPRPRCSPIKIISESVPQQSFSMRNLKSPTERDKLLDGKCRLLKEIICVPKFSRQQITSVMVNLAFNQFYGEHVTAGLQGPLCFCPCFFIPVKNIVSPTFEWAMKEEVHGVALASYIGFLPQVETHTT